jgi:putative sigma-54 modulation protein
MKIIYTGRRGELAPAQEKKLAARFSKLGKLLDRRQDEREAHVILTAQRHLQQAEITVRFDDQSLVGIASGADQFAAMLAAAERLEKQVLKLRTKRRDTKRSPRQEWEEEETAAETEEPLAPAAAGPTDIESRVFRLNSRASRKPMTLEEALLEMEGDRDYLVYRDAQTDRLSVLLRRRDGNFNLIES